MEAVIIARSVVIGTQELTYRTDHNYAFVIPFPAMVTRPAPLFSREPLGVLLKVIAPIYH